MNNKFDELAKGLAQSVTRREAFKRFGVGLAGMVLACFGLASKAQAGHSGCNPGGFNGGYCGLPGSLPCCPGLHCINSGYGPYCTKGNK